MAKRKTPKIKKTEEKKMNPAEERQKFMDKIAEDVNQFRSEIIKDNKDLAPKLDMYAVIYKNLLLEHYKTLNINYGQGDKEEVKKTS